MIRNTAVYVGNGRVLVRTARGFKLFVDANDVSLAPHLIIDGVWEEHVERALRTVVKRGMQVLEVGANVGFFTVLFAHAVGTSGAVDAFEPDPALAALVRDNAEINGFHEIVCLHELALTDSIGTAEFFTRDRHRGNGTLMPSLEQIPWNPSDRPAAITVRTTTLDAHVAATGRRPDLVKIDAEGAEPAVLRGAQELLSDGKPLVLILELIPAFLRSAGEDPQAFLEHLAAHGFRLRFIEERRRARIVDASVETLLQRRYSELLLVR
ncbi:MAG: FkbM family methyltransferase [Candidatus Velthaea sp.]